MPDDSALARTLEAVGDRWTLLIVEALLDRPRRFGELADAVEGIAPNTLSQRLGHLDREALVVARPYQERPPRFTYELTETGRDLAAALHMLAEWGARRSGREGASHETCGTPLQTALWCPTCARAVGDDEARDIRVL
jgi:DNA-binding HxlR family transcriptional regulator